MSQKRNRPVISITVAAATKKWLEATALERSKPGAKVTPGNLIDDLVAQARRAEQAGATDLKGGPTQK